MSTQLRALKAGATEALRITAIDRLVGDDEAFGRVWDATATIPGQFSNLNAAAMFTVLSQLRPKLIVEIGSYLGRSTTFFGTCMRILGGEKVVAIDPHTGDLQLLESLGVATLPSFAMFEAHIKSVGLEDIVTPIVKPSREAALDWGEEIDFLYIDGWHSYDAVIQDGRDWLKHLSPSGVVFIDDYSRYADVHRAVDDLAEEGVFRLWGNSFGQAFGGLGEPTRAAQLLINTSRRPLRRWQYRPRTSNRLG